MRTVNNYQIEQETWEEQQDGGRYHPGRVVIFRDKTGEHRVHIEAGSSDYVDLFREGCFTIVLSHNPRLWYTGIEVFEGDRLAWDVFLQADYEIEEILGASGVDLEPIHIAKRLFARWE